MIISPFSPCWRLPKPDKSAAALAKCNADKTQREADLIECGHDKEAFQAELASAAQTRIELENEIAALNAQVAMLQAQLTDNEAALQEELNTCNINKANIEAALFSANLRIDALTADKAALQTQIEDLQDALNDAEEQKYYFENYTEGLQNQISALQNELVDKQTTITELTLHINYLESLNATKKIITSDTFLNGNGSLSLWIYPKSNNLLIDFHYNTNNMLGYYLYGDQLIYRSNLSVNTPVRTEVLNTWVFWQFIANGGTTYKVYRNGFFVHQSPNYGTLATMCKISHQLESEVRNLVFSNSTAVLAVPTRE